MQKRTASEPGRTKRLSGDALTLADNKLTEDLDIPTYAELEADVKDFEMDFTATVFSNGLLEELEQEDLNELYDLAGEFDTLYRRLRIPCTGASPAMAQFRATWKRLRR